MGIAERTSFRGMEAVRWTGPDGASAIATLQGAHLVSWRLAGGEEMLFLSERSAFEAGRAIRGGIPVCFPQFSERGPLVKHGFARVSDWVFLGSQEFASGTRATFALEGKPGSPAWPWAFRIELAATLGEANLDLELRVANAGDAAFDFAAALHTYLRVSDSGQVTLEGLQGVRYRESTTTGSGVESRMRITAADPIDRIYLGAPSTTRLTDAGRNLEIVQRGFGDTVVWNPGRDLAARMPDMAPGDDRHMLCVEAASIDPLVRLEPGGEWAAGQSIAVESPRSSGEGIAMKQNAVGWFEIYVQDMPRARKFYETVLARKLEKLEAGGLEMWSFAGDPAGAGSAGSLVRMPGFPSGGNSTLVYFVCADCAVEEARVKPAGGRIEKSKFSIGPYGFVALAYDTEGNMFGLHSMK